MLLPNMPQEGDKAPAFSAFDQHGQLLKSSDLKGHRYILYFYPKDDTPTCTVQACNLRDAKWELAAAGVEIIGVSPDSIERHAKFSAKFGLPFRLLADPDNKVITAYGVWGPKQLYGRKYDGLHRTTFLMDAKGTVVDLITTVKSKDHSEQILNASMEKVTGTRNDVAKNREASSPMTAKAR